MDLQNLKKYMRIDSYIYVAVLRTKEARVSGLARPARAPGCRRYDPGFDTQIHDIRYLHDRAVRCVKWQVNPIKK